MLEKRRAPRLTAVPHDFPTERLDDYRDFNLLHVPVEITDISRTGIGFKCQSELPFDHYVNNRIRIGNDFSFYSILKIVRKEHQSDCWHIGCEFLSAPEALSQSLASHETRSPRSAQPAGIPMSIQFFDPQVSYKPF